MQRIKLQYCYVFVTLVTSLLICGCCHCQTVDRLPGENAETFVKRAFKIEDDLPHPVIESEEWDSVKKVIIFFKLFDEGNIGYLLTPMQNNTYTITLIDTLFDQGGQGVPIIESVSFANADKDSAREIIVMIKAPVKAPRYAEQYGEGFYYDTYIYDNPLLPNPAKRLHYFEDISNKLSAGFDGSYYRAKDGKFVNKETAKYKDVASVRAALKQMGYAVMPPSAKTSH